MPLPASVRLADRKDLANKILEKIAEFDRTTANDKEFRERILTYFKPERRID
jgi:hypothetical protein